MYVCVYLLMVELAGDSPGTLVFWGHSRWWP